MCLITLLAAVALIPFWIGFILPHLVAEDKLSYESLTRLSASKSRMEGVQAHFGESHVLIQQIDILHPIPWLFAVIRKDDSDPMIKVSGIELNITPSPAQESQDAKLTPESLFHSIHNILPRLKRVLPRLELHDLSMHSNQAVVQLEHVTWVQGVLKLNGQAAVFQNPELAFTVRLDLNIEPFGLSVVLPGPNPIEINSSLSLQTPFWSISARAEQDTDTVELESEWSSDSWLPKALKWSIPSWRFEIPDSWDTVPVQQTAITSQGKWEDGQFVGKLEGSASIRLPIEAENQLRTFEFSASVSGDLETIKIASMLIESENFRAQTQSPFSYHFLTGAWVGDLSAELFIELAELGREDLSGPLQGVLDLSSLSQTPGKVDAPTMRFSLHGSSLRWRDWMLTHANLIGQFDQDTLRLTELQLQLEDGSTLNLNASYDWTNKQLIALSGDAILEPSMTEPFIGPDLKHEPLLIHIEGKQGEKGFSHQGSIAIPGIQLESVQPVQLFLEWEATDLRQIENYAMELRSENGAKLQSAGSLSIESDTLTLQMADLRVEHSLPSSENRNIWQLQRPANLLFRFPTETEESEFSMDSLHISDQTASLLLENILFGSNRTFTAKVEQFDSASFMRDWLTITPPELFIRQLELELSDQQDLWLGAVLMDVDWSQADHVIQVSGSVQSTPHHILIESLNLSAGNLPWLQLSAVIPAQMHARNHNGKPFDLNWNGALELQAQTLNSQEWIPTVQPYLPLPLQSAEVSVDLKGTPAAPTGSGTIALQTHADEGPIPIPASAIHASLTFDGSTLHLEPLRFQVDKQTLSASGKLVLPGDFSILASLDESPTFWKDIHFQAAIQDGSLAAVAPFLPDILRPNGKLHADISGSLNKGWSGALQILDAQTLPLGTLGALRNIQVDTQLSGNRIELNHLTGKIGRETLEASGWIELHPDKDPTYSISMQGSRLPLVRQAGLLLRSDLNLVLEHNGSLPPTLKGKLLLRDGVFLMDITAFMQGEAGGRTAQTRPPYFSVSQAPFNQWRLNIELLGDSFIQLRTPVVDGFLSTAMQLEGTLEEPFLHGIAELENGFIKFPFAAFRVERGQILINRSDPYTPILDIQGSAQRLDHRLQIDISGPSTDPLVHFTSSPPLSSDQILLMVATGEDPSGTFEISGTQRASKIGTYLTSGVFADSGTGHSSLLSRLSLQWGNKLSAQGKETLDMRFRINDRFELMGEYDEYDQWNTGIRWRLINPDSLSATSIDSMP